MTTVTDLIETLTPLTGLHAATVERMARKLTEANLLPEHAEVEPLHAARLLVALMAARSPLEAVEAVQVYERLPARWAERTLLGDDGAARVELLAVEDLTPPPGTGPSLTLFEQSFVGALAHVIDCAMTVPPEHLVLPISVGARRSLVAPMGIIELPLGQAGVGRFAYSFGEEEDMRYVIDNTRMAVWANLPGSALLALGDRLAGRVVSTETRQPAAVEQEE